ncbi:class I SAM-dependent methyltransferase [Faecalitalea cylindroides]|uniref:class I SAM-dependent methyltransferase n=1 Tax=Faecalitalea cylindroides TaxID=39483 RepID=UPI0022DFFB48|nr:class I SAM-dependent methyltransferase [Faecalitalea cylindroides]
MQNGGNGISDKENLTDVNKTLDYYNKNVANYYKQTASVDFADTQNQFLHLLPKKALILDFGCGSGRDSLAFLKQGYNVEAIDGSEEMCKIASQITGISVRKMLFQELNENEKYDGIWACSSILHLTIEELRLVMNKMSDSLKPGGIIYTSFKYGSFEGERNGRYFLDFKEDSFENFIIDINELEIQKIWISNDVRVGRGEEKWLNVILQKKIG